MKLKSILAATLLMLPLVGNAAVYSGLFRVVEFRLDQNGSAWNLWIKADTPVSNGCSNSSFYVLPIDSASYAKEKYAAVLSAFTAGKRLELYLSGCYGAAPNDYPLADQSRFRVSD